MMGLGPGLRLGESLRHDVFKERFRINLNVNVLLSLYLSQFYFFVLV